MNEDKDIEELTEEELDRELTRISAGERHVDEQSKRVREAEELLTEATRYAVDDELRGNLQATISVLAGVLEGYTANAHFFYHERQQIRSERNRRKRTNEKNEEDKNEDGGLSDELLSEYDELTPKEAHEQGKPGVTSACIFCGGLFSDSPTKRVNPKTKVKTPDGVEYTYWEDETATEPLLHPSCYKTRKAMIDGDEHRTLGAFEGEE